jgi:hypothetical protein
MEMLAFPDIKTCGNGQIGKKGCRQKKGMSGKLADIDVSVRHVADISLTFPTKSIVFGCLLRPHLLGGTLVADEEWLMRIMPLTRSVCSCWQPAASAAGQCHGQLVAAAAASHRCFWRGVVYRRNWYAPRVPA